MKILYYEIKNGLPINEDIQKAIDGFEYLGYEPIPVRMEEMLHGNFRYLAEIHPFVGSIDFMTGLFKQLGKTPEPIDFPEEVLNILERKIAKTTLHKVFDIMDIEAILGHKVKIFVKPVETKLFDGILLSTNPNELHYFKDFSKDTEVWVSDELDILSEHRIYVHNGDMVYGCNYSGDFKLSPSYTYVEKIIYAYKSSPVSYTIDVAVLKDGSTTLIECNDFWAIGGYGISPWDYAKMIKDRYFEIISKKTNENGEENN